MMSSISLRSAKSLQTFDRHMNSDDEAGVAITSNGCHRYQSATWAGYRSFRVKATGRFITANKLDEIGDEKWNSLASRDTTSTGLCPLEFQDSRFGSRAYANKTAAGAATADCV